MTHSSEEHNISEGLVLHGLLAHAIMGLTIIHRDKVTKKTEMTPMPHIIRASRNQMMA